MASNEKKVMGRRLRNSYLSSMISISLVLLLIGVASLLLVSAGSVTSYFKSNMKVSVVMNPSVEEARAQEIMAEIGKLPAVQSVDFISKAQGAKEMEDMLGDDFLSVFETSPIPASVDVTIKPAYVHADSVALFRQRVQRYDEVDDVVWQQGLVESLTSNLAKVSSFLGVLIVLLLFISFVLISNTMRLSVFARRFTIHTMKLVGATKHFIRSPFVWKASLLGLCSAVVALALLAAGLFALRSGFVQMFSVFTAGHFAIVAGVVVVSGVIICTISTWLVVGKLISLPKDELYY